MKSGTCTLKNFPDVTMTSRGYLDDITTRKSFKCNRWTSEGRSCGKATAVALAVLKIFNNTSTPNFEDGDTHMVCCC